MEIFAVVVAAATGVYGMVSALLGWNQRRAEWLAAAREWGLSASEDTDGARGLVFRKDVLHVRLVEFGTRYDRGTSVEVRSEEHDFLSLTVHGLKSATS